MLLTIHYKTQPLRILYQEGHAWFVASDVCAAMRHSNPRIALLILDTTTTRKMPVRDTRGRKQQSNVIASTSLPAFMERFRKPEAKLFREWLIEEGLPALELLLQDVQSVALPIPKMETYLEPIYIRHGECATILPLLDAESVDCLLTDPPAGISFLGAEWDGDKGGREAWIAWLTNIMREIYRVLKPGAHGFVWALPRRSHWTAMALEDAGFEIRDRFTHIFGYGSAKSHRLHGNWAGWETNLKPGVEDWWFIRKPMAYAVTTANMDAYGVGALNISASRIPLGRTEAQGRYPTHLLFTHSPDCVEACQDTCPVKLLDTQSGDHCGSTLRSHHQVLPAQSRHLESQVLTDAPFGYGDTGGAARFFHQFRWETDETPPFLYAGRANPSERHAGCSGMPAGRNAHTSVKPVKLLLHLLKLVTPPRGVVLDPFMGSGSTGVASVQGGFRYIGIEQDKNYFATAQARITDRVRTLPS